MGDIKNQKKLKCSLCGQYYEKEELTVKSNKKYCEKCLEIKKQESEKNKDDWTLLFDYICNLYRIDKPTGLMFKQLKEYRGEDYNYTNIGMYYTLKYYYEILQSNLLDGTGLGIIPYYYDKAKIYYNKVFDLKDVIEEYENNENVVKIKTKKINKNINIRKSLPLISIGEDENEVDN